MTYDMKLCEGEARDETREQIWEKHGRQPPVRRHARRLGGHWNAALLRTLSFKFTGLILEEVKALL